MKYIIPLIIIMTLFSCQTKISKRKSYDAYKQGCKLIEQKDTIGDVDYKKALMLFDDAIRLNPNYITPRYRKILCEIQRGKLDEALQTSEIAIKYFEKKDNKLMPLLYVTAGLIEKNNKNTVKANNYFAKAFEIYELRIEKDNNNIDAIMNKAILLCYMDKKNEAIEFLNSTKLSDKNKILIDQMKLDIKNFNADNILQRIMK